MSAGTIALTNNSANVTGTGTAFTTDLKANDFIVAIVGGVTYTLAVKAITSATALTLITPYGGPTATGNAWTAVPNAALVGITAQVAADVAKAIRGLNLDKANWQGFYTATGDTTINLPDGTSVTGPSWPSMKTTLAKAYNDGGLLSATVTPNTLGNAADFNIYYQTANANALIANGYPIAKAGTLFVTKSAYGCQQMYITFQGEAYVRGLTGTFTPATPNWSDWWPVFTGKSTIPVANGGTGAITAAAARTALGVGYGSGAGTVAQGNDSRLSTIDGKTGGGITGDVVATRPTGAYGVGPTVSSIVYPPGATVPSVQWQMFSEVNATSRYGHLRLWQDASYKDWYFDYASGNAYSPAGWQANSDARIKDKVVRIEDPLEKMKLIKGCTWVRKDDGQKGSFGIGFIAQDIQAVFPDAVSLGATGSLTVDGEVIQDPLALDAGSVSAALHHEAILALMNKIESMEATIADMQKRELTS